MEVKKNGGQKKFIAGTTGTALPSKLKVTDVIKAAADFETEAKRHKYDGAGFLMAEFMAEVCAGTQDEKQRVFYSAVFDYLTARECSEWVEWVEHESIEFPEYKVLAFTPPVQFDDDDDIPFWSQMRRVITLESLKKAV